MFHFKIQQIDFKVCFAIPGKVTVVFDFIRPIAFNIFRSLNSACKSSMFLFPVVLTLGDTKIHVCAANSSDIAPNVKTPINIIAYENNNLFS